MVWLEMSWRKTEAERTCMFCGRRHKVNLSDKVREMESKCSTLKQVCDVCLLKFMAHRMKKK